MSIKTRVNRLFDRYHRDWVKAWDSFLSGLFSILPDEAIERLKATDQNPLEPQSRQISSRLFAELGLDEALWQTWAKQVETFPDFDNPKSEDYSTIPETLPRPPQNPFDAWQITLGWNYPDTLEGHVKARFVYYLAIALRLEAL